MNWFIPLIHLQIIMINLKLNKLELKRAIFVDFKFCFLDTKSKNSIKNILLNKDNIHLLTTQYNQDTNSNILKQLNQLYHH